MNRDRKLGMTLTASALALAILASPIQAADRGNAEFVSGGVGLDARQQMQAQAGQYNLHLEFATARSGEYLSGVEVTITDGRGSNVLSTRTDGPWLLARLPGGAYAVSARVGDTVRRQQISVGADRRHVVMRFPATDQVRSQGDQESQPQPTP